MRPWEAWQRTAERDGWQAAAGRILAEDPRLFRYMTDERAADWRFLLPELPRGHVLCVGGALSTVPLRLAATGRRVSVLAAPSECGLLLARAREAGCTNIATLTHPPEAPDEGSGQLFDLAALLRPAPGAPTASQHRLSLARAAAHLRQGGYLYLEVSRPAIAAPPRLTELRLRALGFRHITSYWPKPGFDNCEMLVRLGDARLQDHYLNNMYFATSPAKRILRMALNTLVSAGLFELSLPGYCTLARYSAGGTSR